MKNRVHYGEFTLDYWVDQLISGAIELPMYQRSFVWNKTQIINLLQSIGRDEFVPPVTIGKIGDKNIIIDGQQRLTSIVLAFLNILPSKYKKLVKIPAATADDEEEEMVYFEWTINSLKQLGSDILCIKQALVDNKDYELLGTNWVNKDFLKKHYLGFAYIIPHQATNEEDRHKFFSTIFRNVNIGGTALLKAESRKSLYYLNKAYVPLFDPEFAKNILIKQFGTDPQPLDFLRQLAIVFDFAKSGNTDQIMKGYKSKSELYYEIFISEVVTSNPTSNIFKNINDVMKIDEIEEQMGKLKAEVQRLSIPRLLSSVIDIDLYMFGLIYWILIKKKNLDNEKINELKIELENKIKTFRDDKSHARTPASLKYLRERVKVSIDLYEHYLK